jgi:hypothetical protein
MVSEQRSETAGMADEAFERCREISPERCAFMRRPNGPREGFERVL